MVYSDLLTYTALSAEVYRIYVRYAEKKIVNHKKGYSEPTLTDTHVLFFCRYT